MEGRNSGLVLRDCSSALERLTAAVTSDISSQKTCVRDEGVKARGLGFLAAIGDDRNAARRSTVPDGVG
jgi:hypothetical protein